MRSVAATCVVLLGAVFAGEASASTLRSGNEEAPESRSILFEFDRGAQPPSRWKLDLAKDGSGAFTNLANAASSEQPVRVSAAVEAKIAAAYPIVQSGKCETKLKNIAKTGKKTLSYRAEGSTAAASCSFNYSDSDALNTLADTMLAVSETMQAGERIAQKHRYDRLGLDAELDVLTDEVRNGRALEIANIAAVLQSVANDERVMERVQRKAARLLQDAGAASADNAR